MTEFSAPHEVTPAADPFEHVAGALVPAAGWVQRVSAERSCPQICRSVRALPEDQTSEMDG